MDAVKKSIYIPCLNFACDITIFYDDYML